MKNSEIAAIFSNIADILELENENIFRIRAYRRAARVLEELTEDILQLAKEKEITDLPGIGNDLADKIKEYLTCGKIKFYEDLKKTTPKTVLNFMDIPGVGPKTAKHLAYELKIKSIKDLEKKSCFRPSYPHARYQRKDSCQYFAGDRLFKKITKKASA